MEHKPHGRPQFTYQSGVTLTLELGCVKAYYRQESSARPEEVICLSLSEFIDEFGFDALMNLDRAEVV